MWQFRLQANGTNIKHITRTVTVYKSAKTHHMNHKVNIRTSSHESHCIKVHVNITWTTLHQHYNIIQHHMNHIASKYMYSRVTLRDEKQINLIQEVETGVTSSWSCCALKWPPTQSLGQLWSAQVHREFRETKPTAPNHNILIRGQILLQWVNQFNNPFITNSDDLVQDIAEESNNQWQQHSNIQIVPRTSQTGLGFETAPHFQATPGKQTKHRHQATYYLWGSGA